jgi:hypothetical protein
MGDEAPEGAVEGALAGFRVLPDTPLGGLRRAISKAAHGHRSRTGDGWGVMSGVFYTYVWGYGRRGGPLTFTSKANRTRAIRGTHEGDAVFAVVSRNPDNPTVQISEGLKGCVLNVWQISHASAATADFGIEAEHTWDKLDDGGYRWPYALQPIRTCSIRNPRKF